MLFLNLDLSQILPIAENLKPAVDRAMKRATERLTLATHAHITEEVERKLHSTRQKYLDHLSFKQVGTQTWLVELEPGAFFIEEGLPKHEMIDDLLSVGRGSKGKSAKPEGMPSGQPKTAKDGSRYRVIPFEHKKGPTSQTAKATNLTDILKASMKQMKIPYASIEKNAAGVPKTGLLHSFDIMKAPAKMGGGAVPTGPTGISHLQGVRVYQHRIKDSKGKESTQRSITTFRVVSSKMKGSGRWMHPGLEPKHFFEEALVWAARHWEDKVKPDVLREIIEAL